MVVRINEWRDRLLARRRGRVAFVLSGGGPFGAIQVGLLQALVTSGITPDMLIGTSVGALNSVFIAHDPTPDGVNNLKDVWLRMRKDDLFPGGRFVSAWNAMKRGSFVYSSSGMRRIIETELQVTTFEELKVETHICGTNLETGQETWFTSGPLMEPLLASGAMPGIFPPVVIDGTSYIDGGVANNVPVSRLCSTSDAVRGLVLRNGCPYRSDGLRVRGPRWTQPSALHRRQAGSFSFAFPVAFAVTVPVAVTVPTSFPLAFPVAFSLRTGKRAVYRKVPGGTMLGAPWMKKYRISARRNIETPCTEKYRT